MCAITASCCSKVISTVITYPLIKLKVQLMHNKGNKSGTNRRELEASNTWSFAQLQDMYGGLYLQLLQTVLKAALLLGLKEKIDERVKKAFGKKK